MAFGSITVSASARAASTYVGSFRIARACSGVLVRDDFTEQYWRGDTSKNIVGPTIRRQNVYRLRRYSASPVSGRYRLPPNVASSHTPPGWYGFTAGPPGLSTSSPLAASAWSRIIHDGSRCRAPRACSRFSGSRSCNSFDTADDCLYVSLVSIRRSSFFTSHPDSRNSTAIQSNRSGCDGGSPCDPKSSVVFTIPVP